VKRFFQFFFRRTAGRNSQLVIALIYGTVALAPYPPMGGIVVLVGHMIRIFKEGWHARRR
jgi:hypothetical protein